VGRTGRLGKRGCASTLFTRSERTDLQQLERTLGIRMENPRSGDTQPERETRVLSNVEHREPATRFKMIPLRGEILQGQLGN
jgi:superfamily II DNA/RNA helicase